MATGVPHDRAPISPPSGAILSDRAQAQAHEVTRWRETGFGPRYEVEGQMAAPDAGVRACALPGKWSKNTTAQCSRKTCPKKGSKPATSGRSDGGAGYEVEFMTLAGETVAVATLLPAQLRPIPRRDIAHVRELQAA